MGTNYYLIEKSRACPMCGHDPAERLHIGKSSSGWCFSLHVIPEIGIHDLDDWRKKWCEPETRIVDEYKHVVSLTEMEACVVDRRLTSGWEETPSGYVSWSAFHALNQSEMGPRGLLRHRIGEHCVGHGEGTWDLIQGEFS